MFSFRLPKEFVDSYREITPSFGYPDAGGAKIGEITYLRTYSRLKDDGTKETWTDTCERVVNGMISIEKDHCKANRLPWNNAKAQRTAQDAYDRMFNFKWTPPGRGIAQMGSPLIMEQRKAESLNNCGFSSTADMTREDPTSPFTFLMLASMNGIGIGFDQLGAKKNFQIYEPSGDEEKFTVPDSREGWTESFKLLLESYLKPEKSPLIFNYSEVRPQGSPIKSFGGVASGPQPLVNLHEGIQKLFESRQGQTLTTTDIADIGNMIGVCIKQGNIRRSAQLLVGSIDDEQFLHLKDYESEIGQRRASWSYLSNNSVDVRVGDDLSKIIPGIAQNGEPGVLWMDTTRNYGRLQDAPDYKDRRVAGFNPCCEQPLESGELCVAGDTLIQTKIGLDRISDLVGSTVEIWNGDQWSTVTPFEAGVGDLYRVKLSDGSHLDVTRGHEWSVKTKTQSVFHRLTTENLKPGMILPNFSLGQIDGKPFEHAYIWGWVAGDGFIDNNKTLALVQEQEASIIPKLLGKQYPWQFNRNRDGYTATKFCRVNVSSTVPLEASVVMRKEDRLPNEVFTWDSKAISDFMGGWIDTDGSLIKQANTDHYVLYGGEGKLRQAQILLRRIGVDHSTLRLFKPKGDITNYGARNQDLYRLLIPSYEASLINTVLKKAVKFGSFMGVNQAHPETMISRANRQKIISIEKIAENEPTYCFEETIKHMGVFGNVLTYQCTLVDLYLENHETFEDFKKTLKVAYLYAKTVTLIPTTWPKTNAIMQRNRRIGTSVSGVADFADTRGLPELRSWLDRGYAEIKRLDVTYSEWLCVRESIRVSTVKPAGTTGLVAGVSPGIHWTPGGKYFMRTIRFGKFDPMVPLFRAAKYRVEDDVTDKDNTVVVYFPVKSRSQRSEREVSIFEKASLAALAQRYWSDNAVSVTVSFDPETEGKHVGTVLSMYEGQLKTISFLPMLQEGAYAQMPYGRLTEQEWVDYSYQLLPIDFSPIYQGLGFEAIGEDGCTTDSCEIKEFKMNNEEVLV